MLRAYGPTRAPRDGPLSGPIGEQLAAICAAVRAYDAEGALVAARNLPAEDRAPTLVALESVAPLFGVVEDYRVNWTVMGRGAVPRLARVPFLVATASPALAQPGISSRTIVRTPGLLYASEVDFSQPFRAVTPTLDGPVLRVLARTTHPMTRQQVADLVGEASEAGVRKVLRRLAEQGVVIEQRIGRHYAYVGNREHILWPAVEVFMSAADRLDTTIRERVEAWGVPALSVELFGSVAAGTSTADSDVDLMVYRPSLTDDQVGLWDSQVAELRMAVERWTGNACEILEIDPRTLVEMAAEDELVLRAPRVPITGLNIAAAVPDMEMAKSLQKAMASGDVSR